MNNFPYVCILIHNFHKFQNINPNQFPISFLYQKRTVLSLYIILLQVFISTMQKNVCFIAKDSISKNKTV